MENSRIMNEQEGAVVSNDTCASSMPTFKRRIPRLARGSYGTGAYHTDRIGLLLCPFLAQEIGMRRKSGGKK